jgi:hypothetical protein
MIGRYLRNKLAGAYVHDVYLEGFQSFQQVTTIHNENWVKCPTFLNIN